MFVNIDSLDNIISYLEKYLPNIPIILDPIFKSTSNCKLFQKNQKNDFRKIVKILPRIFLFTPNLIEAREILGGKEIETKEEMLDIAKKLHKLGAKNILLKGGHLEGNKLYDILLGKNIEQIFWNRRIGNNRNIYRGTGCVLSSATSCFFNKKDSLEDAVKKGREFLYKSIKNANKIATNYYIL